MGVEVQVEVGGLETVAIDDFVEGVDLLLSLKNKNKNFEEKIQRDFEQKGSLLVYGLILILNQSDRPK